MKFYARRMYAGETKRGIFRDTGYLTLHFWPIWIGIFWIPRSER